MERENASELESASVKRGSRCVQRGGYTLLEVLVALAILILGASVWWSTYGVHARLQAGYHHKREALSIARNEMERIRYTRAPDLESESFTVNGRSNRVYRVERQVADPSGLESVLDELGPESSQPVEVRILVRLEEKDEEYWGEEPRPLADISLLIPEYAWY